MVTKTCCKLFRNQAGYSAVTPNLRTKSFIKQSFISHNKTLYASKEIKEFPELLQRSNSVRDNRKHIGLMTSESAKITFAQSKRRILPVLNDKALF